LSFATIREAAASSQPGRSLVLFCLSAFWKENHFEIFREWLINYVSLLEIQGCLNLVCFDASVSLCIGSIRRLGIDCDVEGHGGFVNECALDQRRPTFII
jgi:hypothetical protein